MKSVITAICLLIILVILFVIIDRKDFYSSDSASVQEETVTETTVISLEPVEKPTENKPVEVKPVESMPAAVNPAEMKPVTESKSATAAKPVEPNLVVEAKHAPAAIPVVSAEEAEKLNAEAIEHQKILNRKRDITILEGKVLSISACPDPRDIDYPDCNLTISVSLNDLKHSIVMLIVPCIRNSETVISQKIRKESLVAFKIIDESTLTEEERSIQVCDDDPDYELEYCYAANLESISCFSKTSIYKKKEVDGIIYDAELPLMEHDIATRADYINKELDRISKIVSDYSFDDGNEVCNELLKITKGLGENYHPYVEVVRNNGLKKVFPIGANLMPVKFINAAFSDPSNIIRHNADMIIQLNIFLKERGILLIVVPYPQHFEAFVDRFALPKKLSTYNINRYRYMQYLLQGDVEVLDLEPLFEKELKSDCYFHRLLEKDLHPSEMGAFSLSQVLCHHLAKYEFFEKMQKNNYSIQTKSTTYSAEYYDEEIKDLETVTIIQSSSPLNKESPFLLVGDSFTKASNIQKHIANAIKTKINLINANGSFTETLRLIQERSRDISANTKVLFLINSSAGINGWIKPFVNDKVVLYPNNAIFPNMNLHAEGKDLEEKISISFDLDISDHIPETGNYKLVISLSSTQKQIYELSINSIPCPQTVKSNMGHGIIEYPLSGNTSQLHIEISSVPDEGYPIKNGQNLTLTIDKIILVEE